MGPYKCPECGVWWVGLEHRCRPTQFTSYTTDPLVTMTSGTAAGHCHGCTTLVCMMNDHVPCMSHQNGWTTA